MAELLYRLGHWVARRRWVVVAAWLALLTLLGAGAATLSKPLTNDLTMPNSRFERVLDTLREKIPASAGQIATVVLRSDAPFTEAQKKAVAATVATWDGLDKVSARDPFATQAQIDASAASLTEAKAKLDAGRAQLQAARGQLDQARAQLTPEQLAQQEATLRAGEAQLATATQDFDAAQLVARSAAGMRVVSEDGRTAMTQVSVSGTGGVIDPTLAKQVMSIGNELTSTGVRVDYSKELTEDISSVMGTSELVGLAVAALVLVLTLGSLVAAGLPLVSALVGVGVGVSGAMALTHWIEMTSVSPTLALMLGLAVGIDYSLFLINRHQQQLRRGMPVAESIALAVGTAGNAVVFAGLTVVIALAALALTGFPFLAVMGYVAAATVAVAVLVAITLTPALLAILGLRVLPKRNRGALATDEGREQANATPPPGSRAARRADQREHSGWAASIAKRPWLAILGVAAVIALLATPAASLRLGLPDGASEPPSSTAYRTYDTIRNTFGAGANGPILLVAQPKSPVAAGDAAAVRAQAAIIQRVADVPGVVRVVPAGISTDRTTLAFQVQPEGGPAEASTVELVRELDKRLPQIGSATGSTLGLTGLTVANIDISQQLFDAMPLYLGVVVGLSLVLLLLVFRSVLVPLLATAGFLLSLVAAFGAVVAVFQMGHLGGVFGVHEPGAILSFLPTLLIGVLFGLAMDYQVFLVSAMRESHVHGQAAREAVVTGFNHSARVVTAAAVIMTAVFGGFVWSHLAMVRPIGLGLAVGVLVDAFLVRMTLTPAVLTLLGERAWWLPAWLDRLLPDVDVEGAKLERTHPVH